ncbi:hypothetical protein ASD28_17365 [Massilia sp. Root133]|nr:hypothetical protein ASD28_17365 [Massilia sp. Root133]KQZ52568.1 hypothetical protein ASD92_18795 [Massilia sp. Root1485]
MEAQHRDAQAPNLKRQAPARSKTWPELSGHSLEKDEILVFYTRLAELDNAIVMPKGQFLLYARDWIGELKRCSTFLHPIAQFAALVAVLTCDIVHMGYLLT